MGYAATTSRHIKVVYIYIYPIESLVASVGSGTHQREFLPHLRRH